MPVAASTDVTYRAEADRHAGGGVDGADAVVFARLFHHRSRLHRSLLTRHDVIGVGDLAATAVHDVTRADLDSAGRNVAFCGDGVRISGVYVCHSGKLISGTVHGLLGLIPHAHHEEDNA